MREFEAPQLMLTSLSNADPMTGSDNMLPIIPKISENMMELTKIE